MKLAIFGATGAIGRHLVDKALSQGHQVTAFARTPSALGKTHRHLVPLAGDINDQGAVREAVADQDAVLVALGAGRKGKVRAAGTRHVIDAMHHHDVARLICLSSLGVGDSAAHLTLFYKYVIFGVVLRAAMADHALQEKAVMSSGLDWTLVRPGSFTDGPETGDYRFGFPATERNLTLKISKTDVAHFMLRQLTDDTYLHAAPGLSY